MKSVEYSEYGDVAIQCPCGKGEWQLHHDVMRVVSRAEDSDGLVVEVEASACIWDVPTRTRPTGPGDIKGRRGHIEIEFMCEVCPRRPVLVIQQHKGSTFLFWDDTK